MAYKVTTAPASEPITLTEAKNWLKVSSSSEDDIITMLIESERQFLESKLNQKLVTQTIIQKIDSFPVGQNPIYLEANPVQSITSITYKDAIGSTDTFNSSNYTLDSTSGRARVYLKQDKEWPTLISEDESVTVEYVAGYGAESAVPPKLKRLLYHGIGYAYENRMNPVNAKRTYLDKLIGLERINWFE